MILSNLDIHKAKEKLAYYLLRWRNDTVAFVIEACRADKFEYPTDKQVMVLRAYDQYGFVACHAGRNLGKSRVLAWIIWKHIITKKKMGKALKTLLTGPSRSQVEDVAWSELSVVKGHLIPFLSNRFIQNSESIYCLEADPKLWFVSPRTARKDNLDAIRGFHGGCFLGLDEASGVVDEAHEELSGSLAEEGATSLMISNPTRLSGYFYRVCNKTPGKWKVIHLNCHDSLLTKEYSYDFVDPMGMKRVITTKGLVNPEWIESMDEEYGKNSATYAAHVLGIFPISEEDQLIQKEWIDKAFRREYKEDTENFRIAGVDIAWQGQDDSCIVIRKGNNIESIESWHGNDPTESSDKVKGICEDLALAGKKVDFICVDATGMGAGVYSNLRKEGFAARAVFVGEAPLVEIGTKCKLMRDYLWWQTRLFFKDSSPYFHEDTTIFKRLAEELSVVQYENKAKVIIEDKKSLRKRVGYSPDIADGLCMTFYMNSHMPNRAVKKKKRRRHGQKESFSTPKTWKVV